MAACMESRNFFYNSCIDGFDSELECYVTLAEIGPVVCLGNALMALVKHVHTCLSVRLKFCVGDRHDVIRGSLK